MSLGHLTLVCVALLSMGCQTPLTPRRGPATGPTGPTFAGTDAGPLRGDAAPTAPDAGIGSSSDDASSPSDPCASLACEHGACVVSHRGQARCACLSGFTPSADGTRCEPTSTVSSICDGVECSGHGSCLDAGGTPACDCEPGYASSGLECIPATLDPCAGVTCSGHGSCAPFGGRALCSCVDGFTSTGADCVASGGPNPCDGVTCGGHGSCYVAERTHAPQCACDDGYYARISATDCRSVEGSVCEGVSCGVGTCRMLSLGPVGTGQDCLCPPGHLPHGRGCMRVERTHCRDVDGSLRPRGDMRCSRDDSSVEICRDANDDGDVEWVTSERCAEGACSATGCLVQAGQCETQNDCPDGTVCITGDHGTTWSIGICMAACDCSNCGNCDPEDFAPSGTNYCGASPGSRVATQSCHAPCPDGGGCIPFGDVSVCWPIEGCYDAGEAT